MSEYIPVKLRNLVRKRAANHCEYCRIPEDFSPQPFCLEHILACQGCNSYKATRTEFIDEISNETVKLFNPRESRWKEHFVWNEDFTKIIGITPQGRATVKCLKMNRLGLKNLRRVLYKNGAT